MTDPNGRPLLTVYRRGEHDEPAAATPAVIAVVGEVDLYTAPLLATALRDALHHCPVVNCDLTGVTFFSAAGISELVRAAQHASQAGHRLHVRDHTGTAARLLRMVGLDDLLHATAQPSRSVAGRTGTAPTSAQTTTPDTDP
jgi:anti-anti-sigma factor